MGASFESEEATRPRRGFRLLGLVQWVLFAVVLERWGWMLWGWAASSAAQGAWMGVGPQEFYQIRGFWPRSWFTSSCWLRPCARWQTWRET